MNTWEDRSVGSLMHDRIIGALDLCCRLGEMLLIQNNRVDWDTHTIGIPADTTKDRENRRTSFHPEGRVEASTLPTVAHARWHVSEGWRARQDSNLRPSAPEAGGTEKPGTA